MKADKKKLYLSAFFLLALFLPILFVDKVHGRIIAAVLSAISAAIIPVIIKKRSILSINKQQVLLLISVSSALYLIIYYLSGIEFGFYRSTTVFSAKVFFSNILPVFIIIISFEIIRYVFRAQKNIACDILSYVLCVISDLLIGANFTGRLTFGKFMDLAALLLLPAIMSNLLCHYISKRYGFYPNIVYRSVVSLYMYFIPFYPSVPDSLVSFANILAPLVILAFIRYLYEGGNKFAANTKKNRWQHVVTAAAVVIMISTVMLISCQFKYGMLVIATESMTGEINKGDAIIYEEYDGHTISEGQVIVFRKDDRVIVHRVEAIQRINGSNRYYTKGDANDGLDSGYITDGNIEGVILCKVPYIGYPSIWLRKLFK